MMIFVSRKICIILLCLLITFPISAFAAEPKLTDIIVTNTSDHLILYMNVENAFTDAMEQGVIKGVSVTFTFHILLYKVHGLWLNEKIADFKETHELTYSRLTKAFTVKRSWEDTPHTVDSFAKAKNLMTEIDSLEIVRLNRLEKGMTFQLRAKAELQKYTLPYYLHYLLFFVSLWDFETDWYTIDFIY